MKYKFFQYSYLGLLLALFSFGIFSPQVVSAQDTQSKKYATPVLAFNALIAAAKSNKPGAVLAILGENNKEWLTSGDPVQDRLGVEEFIGAYDQKNGIEMEGGDKAVLVVGDDDFPFPFPVIKTSEGWEFDADQGREELIDRRVGRNELTTIKVLQAIHDAQIEYAVEDRNGNGALEYASKFRSSEGKTDGLFWPTSDSESPSPLGPLIAEAVKSGYGQQKVKQNDGPVPFHGYYFKMLSAQGADAEGGAQDYLVNDKMIGGFAVLAYPAKYDNSGIMSFLINQDGKIFEADLGEDTADEVSAIKIFNPDQNWKKVETE